MILRETQNQNDADDANDAESGIWYRDIPKTASQASSASRSSRKDTAGGLGYTPEMCMWMTTCYASKTHLLPRRCQINPIPIQIRIFPKVNRRLIHAVHKSEKILKSNPKPQSESVVIHPKILTRKSESVLIHSLR